MAMQSDVMTKAVEFLPMGESPETLQGAHPKQAGLRSFLKRVGRLFTSPDGQVRSWVLGLILVVAVGCVYSNTLHGPFLYDDHSDIIDNPTIRHLWPLWDVFYVSGQGFATRPVANITFAMNYALGGLNPFSFHVTNLIIHVGAALAFLGVVRRTLSLPQFQARFAGHIPTLALVTAGLWALHPLQTEAVSYITQRYESLMGLFVLLTFYCVVRFHGTSRPRIWAMLASLACLLALGSKEVAVSVPILVLLFDRTFLAGSFRGAWQERRELYLGLAFTWVCFGFIQIYHPIARSWAGAGVPLPWWRYALNQPAVILHYLRLVVWPHPQNFDYFWRPAGTWHLLAPGLVAMGSMLGLTFWNFNRRPEVAFLSISFLMILAPTSSFMPILDLAVEHRMYLPLAPALMFLVLVVFQMLQTAQHSARISMSTMRVLAVMLVAISPSFFGVLTYLRNEDYRNSLDLWREAADQAPNNPRAHHNYAFQLAELGYFDEAIRQYHIAIHLAPNVPLFRSNLGTLLGKIGRYPESLDQLRLAVRMDPNNTNYVSNLGATLMRKGSLDNAGVCFETVISMDPHMALPYANLALIKEAKNKDSEALSMMQKAVELDPHNPTYQFDLGEILLKLGDIQGARSAFQRAIQMNSISEALSDLAWAIHGHGLERDALQALRKALRMNPGSVKTQTRLARILATSSDGSVRNGAEAVVLAEGLVRSYSTPPPDLLDLLALAQAEMGRFEDAKATLQQALSQSKDGKAAWVPELEKHLAYFKMGEPYHDPVRPLSQTGASQAPGPAKID